MKLLDPTPPPFDPHAWRTWPFAQRARAVCAAWAEQGYGAPLLAYAAYAAKAVAYVGCWFFFCSFSFDLHDFSTWWSDPLALQKAILWSLLFEGLGLGCGSGPLTGRYFPPIGAALYWLRPGTTRLPAIGSGHRRTLLDVALYAALLLLLLFLLLSRTIDLRALTGVAVLIPLLGLRDKTIFLALRSEHYWVTVICMFSAHFLAGAKAIQLALWFWAGVSKLNHHFPAVVCVMTSNSPTTRLGPLRRWLYRSFPDDLRPSTLAVWLAHGGTALELAVPLLLAFAPAENPILVVGLVFMLLLHAHITSSVPMGVPLEWNIMVVYGALVLFAGHPEISVFEAAEEGALLLLLLLTLVVLPLVGNFAPRALSFLLSMRYYAGNWAWSVWLFKEGSHVKLQNIPKSAPWIFDQLARFYDDKTARGLFAKVMAFRLMHLHGRLLPLLLPQLVDKLEDYEWLDGEVVAGLVLGWNFGEGHLHQEQLLAAVQAQCGFAAGEVRCVFVEGQPLGGATLQWRLHDAATGLIAAGETDVATLRAMQPWGSAGESG